ncbi:MAG: VWA domain-containing protein [Prevotella sp.]|nr:VWA domain-containing protein [Prevotella sp.]
MKKHVFRNLAFAMIAVSALSLTSCLSDDEETIVLETPNTGIPDDSQASPNPQLPSTTTYVPNIQTTIEYINGIPVISIDMTGVKNPDGTEWLRLYGTGDKNQNIWVEVDDIPKGIDVYNNADKEAGKIVKTDIVFTVDNSGSMDDEADAIARDIISWSQLLVNSNLDARFGVVGYEGPITGAINLTSVNNLSDYLNEGTGTSRTYHFGGADASTLQSLAYNYTSGGWYECGAAAIRFANDNFSFRPGANRIYVNFTDEPNQPNGKSGFSVQFFEDQENWPAAYGTVHTVYSDSRFNNNRWNYEEQPWLISEYTGGTTIFAPYDFSGVTLEGLPVTGAMENSYIIRFTNIADKLDGKQHKVHITIRSKDGTVCADKIFYVTFLNSGK